MAATHPSGAGGIAQLPVGSPAAVSGTLRVRSPLAAEFSGKPCAYFKAEIEREEVYYERDSQGREERRTRTTTVYSNMKYGQCLIEDQTGKMGIDFDGANVEAIQTVNEPTAAPSSGSGVVAGVLSALASSSSTYTRKETILPADIPVYALGGMGAGYAAALGGELISALGPEDDPASAAVAGLLARQQIPHTPVRVVGHPADYRAHGYLFCATSESHLAYLQENRERQLVR